MQQAAVQGTEVMPLGKVVKASFQVKADLEIEVASASWEEQITVQEIMVASEKQTAALGIVVTSNS